MKTSLQIVCLLLVSAPAFSAETGKKQAASPKPQRFASKRPSVPLDEVDRVSGGEL